MTDTTTIPAVLTGARAMAELLDSAHRYGLPMPFSADATEHSVPRLQVGSVADWNAWRAYVDQDDTLTVEAHDDARQLWLHGTAYECRVDVNVCVGDAVVYADAVRDLRDHGIDLRALAEARGE